MDYRTKDDRIIKLGSNHPHAPPGVHYSGQMVAIVVPWLFIKNQWRLISRTSVVLEILLLAAEFTEDEIYEYLQEELEPHE